MDFIDHQNLVNKHIIRIEDTEEGIQVLYGRSENYEGMVEIQAKQETDSSRDVDIDIVFPIAKVAKEERLITGIVLEPQVVDAHRDFESESTIKTAAHNFLRKYNDDTRMGIQHQMFGSIGIDLVESYLAPQDFILGTEDVKKGSWVITVKVADDEVWKRIKKGEITGFSIGGTAKSKPSQPSPS